MMWLHGDQSFRINMAIQMTYLLLLSDAVLIPHRKHEGQGEPSPHPESPAYPFRWQHELRMCMPVRLHLMRLPDLMPLLITYTPKMKDVEDKNALNKYKSKICWIIYLFTHKYGFFFLLTTSNSVKRRPVHSSYFANLHHKEILHNFLLFHFFSFHSLAVHKE